MRVLQLSFFADRQGRHPDELLKAWPTLTQVAEAARAQGIDVSVLQAARENAVIDRGGVRYHFVTERNGARATARRPARLLARARELAPELIHVQGLGFPLQTRQLQHAVPHTPLIVQDHADRPPVGWRRRTHRWLFADLAAAAFTERDLAKPFFDAGVFRPDLPIHEVLEGSTTMVAEHHMESRAEAGMSGNPCVLWVGRLTPNKDPLTILAGFARFVTEFPEALLYMCYSDDALLPEVEKMLSADPSLAARVRLLGLVPHAEMPGVYAGADLFVLGSHREGSGYALLEAMACGVTPVVTDIPAFRAITGGVVGELFPVGDAEAFARALANLAKQDRAFLRVAALNRFRGALSYESVGKQLKAAYEAVLS